MNHTRKAAPENLRSTKIPSVAAPHSTAPSAIHGLNLPKRERVLSTMTPMMGSLRASKIRIATRTTVTTTVVDCEMCSTSVR